MKDNGGYCLPCVIFGKGQDGIDLGILVSRPMTKFTKAVSTTLPNHQDKESHKNAVTMAAHFLEVMQRKREAVNLTIDQGLAARVATNRLKLKAIVDTVLLCGRQNIALRGHRDNHTDVEAVRWYKLSSITCLFQVRTFLFYVRIHQSSRTSPCDQGCFSPYWCWLDN